MRCTHMRLGSDEVRLQGYEKYSPNEEFAAYKNRGVCNAQKIDEEQGQT